MRGSSIRWLALPPWRRAPLRLWRAPALVLAVLGAAGVLGFAAGSRPLLVTSTSTSVLADDLDEGCAYAAGLTVDRRTFVVAPAGSPRRGGPLDPIGELDRSTAVLRRRLAPFTGLDPLVTTLFTDRATAAVPGGGPSGAVQLMSRTGATRHIRVLHDAGGAGVWITDATARQLAVGAGDRLELTVGPGAADVRIRGVYADLRNGGLDGFWCSQQRAFIETFPVTPAPTILLDQPELLRVLLAGKAPFVATTWEAAPGRDGWTLRRARPTVERLRSLALEAGNPTQPLARELGTAGGAKADSIGTVEHARDAARDAAASIGPAALGTAVVALLVLVVAARTWLARRHEEVRVLTLRGAGPSLIALKGVLELGPPALIGGAVGLAAGAAAVRRVGPATPVDAAAVRSAALLVVAAIGAALAAMAAIIGLGTRHISVTADGAGTERPLWPWELLTLTLGGAAYWELQSSTGATRPGASHVDSLVLLFPVLLLAGGAGLSARLGLRVLTGRRARSRSRERRDEHLQRRPRWLWAWLMARRLTASPARAVPVVTATALAIGMVVLSSSLSASLRATVQGKGLLGPGAEQVFGLIRPQPVPPDFPARARSTAVLRSSENSVVVAGHEPADVLGLDPTTFARAAYWDGSFADRSLPSLLRLLADPAGATELPVLAVGDGLPDHFSLSLDGLDGPLSVPVHVVARPKAFPGFHQNTTSPLVVASSRALQRLGFSRGAEIWVRGRDPGLGQKLLDEHVDVISAVQAADRLTGSLRPQLAVFDYVRVVGGAAAVVAWCGLGLYFAAAADRRRLGRVLAVQMGLRRRDQLLATVAEIGAMVVGGSVVGAALAWVAFRLVVSDLDPLPGAPPAMIVRVDRPSILVCAAGVVATIVIASILLEGRARRGSLHDLLHRDG